MNPPSDTPRPVATPCPTPSGDDWAKAATRDIDTYLEGLDFSLLASEAAKISAIILKHAAPQLERLAKELAAVRESKQSAIDAVEYWKRQWDESRTQLDLAKALLFDEGKNFSNLTAEYERLGSDLTAANERLARLEAELAKAKKDADEAREIIEELDNSLQHMIDEGGGK